MTIVIDLDSPANLRIVSCSIERPSPAKSKRNLGWAALDSGHNLVPLPPAGMTECRSDNLVFRTLIFLAGGVFNLFFSFLDLFLDLLDLGDGEYFTVEVVFNDLGPLWQH